MSFRTKLLIAGLALGSIATPVLASGDEPSSWYMTVGSDFESVGDTDITSKETGFNDVDGEI